MITGILYTAVITAVATAAIVTLARQVLDGRAVIRLAQAEMDRARGEESEILATHADLLAELCWRCKDGTGRCICVSQCGARACAGGVASDDSGTDWDAEWLRWLAEEAGQ